MGIPMNPESIEQDLAYSNAYDDPGFTEATFAFKPQPPLPDAVQRTTGPPTSPDGRSTGSTREEQLAESNHIKGRCRQAKERRDSFGFLPDWGRSSLNACELNA